MGGEKDPMSLRKWWENSQKKDKGFAENAGKEKQEFTTDGENALKDKNWKLSWSEKQQEPVREAG